MSRQPSEPFSELEKHYNNWLGSANQVREVACTIREVSLLVVFNQGHWVFPTFSVVPERKLSTVNVVSKDPKVRHVFEKSLARLPSGSYMFPEQKLGDFKLRFFKSEEALRKRIDEENESYERHRSPSLIGKIESLLL